MRSSQTCSKCQSRKLYVIDPVRQPNQENQQQAHAMVVTCAQVGMRIEAGTFEAWVCATCGYTELYAKDAVPGLWQLSQRGSQTGVRYLDGSPDTGTPFR